MIPISTPVPIPTVPGFLGPGGKRFEDIWWEASVIPYASSTGAPNLFSRSLKTVGANAAEQDRMKRND